MNPLDDRLVVGPRWAATGDRRWTLVGNLGQPGELDAPRGAVDPAGLISVRPGGWTLDWWIGAEDRWHLPSREAAVRQRLVEGAPVVETSMRVPGGDAVQRVCAVRTGGGPGGLVVEIENATPVPFAVALAVRPYGLDGPAPIHHLCLDGSTVSVDERAAIVLPRPPNRAAASVMGDGDCAAVVFEGGAPADAAFDVRCPEGGAQAALVYPLPHTATLRVLLPFDHQDGAANLDPASAPAARQVASGWTSHASSGIRTELPAGRFRDAVEANRRTLLLAAAGDGTGAVAAADRAAVAGTLDRWGHLGEAGILLAAMASEADDGRLVAASDRQDGEPAVLAAVADHVALAGDDELLAALLPAVAASADRLRRATGGARRLARRSRRLLPAGDQPAWLGPGRFYRDDVWAVAGLRAAAALFTRAGDGELAGRARADADALWHLLATSWPLEPPPVAGEPLAAGPEGAPTGDAWVVAGLVLASSGVLPPSHPAVGAIIDAVRRAAVDGGVRVPASGSTVSPELTAELARVELARRDPAALERLDRLLGWASSTWAWPEEVDPASGAAARGAGHHLPAAAAFLRLVRELLVADAVTGAPGAHGADARLVLLPVLPPAWRGHGVEVHGAPTRAGRLSYAVRWHGERPALLWELEAHDGVGDVELVAPGLDPAWRGSGPRGEALLAVG